MRFYSANVLWLLFAPLILIFVWFYFEKRAQKKLELFSSSHVLKKLLGGVDYSKIILKNKFRFFLLFLSIVFSIIALARPQMGVREETLPSQGLDIVFLLDVSNSMLAEDVVPSRLKKAKHIVRNFVDRLSGDRAGVVVFAGSAYPAIPLTTDYDFIRQNIEILSEKSLSNQGSDLAKGLKVAVGLLDRGGMSDSENEADKIDESALGSRVIVVLSDGEATEGEEAKFADILKSKGIKVFSIGVGSLKGAPIPLRDVNGSSIGFKKDSTGTPVHTKLESKNLESLASKTDGKFYSASTNEGEVEEILSLMNGLNRVQGEGRRVTVYDEGFQYPLFLSIFSLLLMIFIRPRVLVKSFAIFLLVVTQIDSVYAGATSLREYSETQKGVEAYSSEDFSAAIEHFGKAQSSSPQADLHHMNLGDALLKSAAYKEAITEFEAVTKSADVNQAAKGFYNMGKTYEAQKDHEKALQAFQSGHDLIKNALKNSHLKPDGEVLMKIKRALESAQQKKDQQQKQDQQQSDSSQGDKSKGEGSEKDKDENKSSGNKNNDQKAPPTIPKSKPKFKPEKLSESDASRVLKQLQEQKQKSQQKVMRNKSEKFEQKDKKSKTKDERSKDW